jgi:hypothetical protein
MILAFGVMPTSKLSGCEDIPQGRGLEDPRLIFGMLASASYGQVGLVKDCRWENTMTLKCRGPGRC